MQTMDDYSAPELLFEFLREEFNNQEIPRELWDKMVQQYGDGLYQEILYALTQMRFTPEEARAYWSQLQTHRQFMQDRLGRDVGLRVAMADFFINVQPRVENPMLVEISLFLQKEASALRDELTGLYNRRFFNRILPKEMERARRYQQSLSLLMIDVDHFKLFNDTHGHRAGDDALSTLADIFRRNARVIDHIVRYGGEEFALILPRANSEQAILAAERIRSSVAASSICGQPPGSLTISVGSATFPLDAGEGMQLLDLADQALYEAKHQGRNRVFARLHEKRDCRRYPLDLDILVQAVASGRLLPGRTLDISTGGVLCRVPNPPQELGNVEIILQTAPQEAELRLKGDCVRIARDSGEQDLYYIGVKFTASNEKERAELHRLIAGQSRS